jgi:hypothetical protein
MSCDLLETKYVDCSTGPKATVHIHRNVDADSDPGRVGDLPNTRRYLSCTAVSEVGQRTGNLLFNLLRNSSTYV